MSAIADYDAYYQQLRAANVGHEAAEREARRKFPDAVRELALEEKRRDDIREKEEQAEFRDDCVRCGVGYGTGDRFAARTHLIKLGLATVVGEMLEPIRSTRRTA